MTDEERKKETLASAAERRKVARGKLLTRRQAASEDRVSDLAPIGSRRVSMLVFSTYGPRFVYSCTLFATAPKVKTAEGVPTANLRYQETKRELWLVLLPTFVWPYFGNHNSASVGIFVSSWWIVMLTSSLSKHKLVFSFMPS